jgi:hypothetical protein
MDAAAFPPIPLALLEALEKRHQEHFATPGDTLDALMFAGGQRELVKWLRAVYEEQTTPTPDENAPEEPSDVR